MGDSNHTPAPWEPKTKTEWESGFDFFAGEDGAYVFLADVGPEDIPLIAAAPDLLAALKALLIANDAVQTVLCDGPDVPGFDPSALGKAQAKVTEAEAAARAAIAKAEGRS